MEEKITYPRFEPKNVDTMKSNTAKYFIRYCTCQSTNNTINNNTTITTTTINTTTINNKIFEVVDNKPSYESLWILKRERRKVIMLNILLSWGGE